MLAGTRPEKGRGSTNWLPLRRRTRNTGQDFGRPRPGKDAGQPRFEVPARPKQPASHGHHHHHDDAPHGRARGRQPCLKILSHQVAADAVHSRELAALQLKYATKTTELDAAKTRRGEAHRPQHEEVLFTNDDSEIAGDLNSLKAQYNKLTRATSGVARARTGRASPRSATRKLRKRMDCSASRKLYKSRWRTSTRPTTPRSRLWNPITTAIKVEARGGVEAGTRREEAPHRRGPIKTGLVKGGPVESVDRPRRVRTPPRGPADAARGGGRGGRARRPRDGPGRARAAAQG